MHKTRTQNPLRSRFRISLALLCGLCAAPQFARLYAGEFDGSGALTVNSSSSTHFAVGYAIWFGNGAYQWANNYNQTDADNLRAAEITAVTNGNVPNRSTYGNKLTARPQLPSAVQTATGLSVGYYSDQAAVITHHAEKIVECGIDIIVPDLTNLVAENFGPNYNQNDIHVLAIKKVYEVIGGMLNNSQAAPRIIPALGAQKTADITVSGSDNKSPITRQLELIRDQMRLYRKTAVLYDDKPVVMIYRNTPVFSSDSTVLAAIPSDLKDFFTIRWSTGYVESQSSMWQSGSRTAASPYKPYTRAKDGWWSWTDRVYASDSDAFSSYALPPGSAENARMEWLPFDLISYPSNSDPWLINRDGAVLYSQLSKARQGNPLFAFVPHWNFFIDHDSGYSTHFSRDISPTQEWGSAQFDLVKSVITRYRDTQAGSTAARFSEISARAITGSSENVFIFGLTLAGGTHHQRIVAKAIGPTLTNFGFSSSDVAPNPQLALFDSSSLLGSNDDWTTSSDPTGLSLASAIYRNSSYFINHLNYGVSMGSTESALTAELAPGSYTYHINEQSGASRIAHLRVTAMDEVGPVNIQEFSGRARVEGGGRILIYGFAIDKAAQVVIRSAGPSLSGFGVPNTLEDPKLELFNSSGTLIASASDAADSQTSSPAWPLHQKEAGLVQTLAAGSYTVHVSNQNPGATADGVAYLSIRKN